MAPVVVLVGSPGAGKTSVGRRVADRLGVGFLDTDQAIEKATGKSVSDIFVSEGEAQFRLLEADAVREAVETFDGVVALGGGAVMTPATQDLLASQRVIWLKVGLPDAANRVGLNTARPLLLGNVRGTLLTLLEKRNPVYESVATHTIDTSGKGVREVVDTVVGLVGSG